MSNTATRIAQPWSVSLAAQDVPAGGQHYDLVADATVRAAITTLAGVQEIARLEASFDVTPQRGGGLHLVGEVTATVSQICVVTLEPMHTEIAEPIDLVFVSAIPVVAEAGNGSEAAAIDDQPEVLVNGSVDLGAIATEFLILSLDPYPRKPGAVFAAPPAEDPSANPFAALAALKRAPDS